MRLHTLPALALLLACAPHAPAADATRGQALYEARCGACHALAEHGPGPALAGLVGCRAGSRPGYDYSPALARSGIVWSGATLDRWLADPGALVPGNKMMVRLADDAGDRGDLVAFLQLAGDASRACPTGDN